MSRYANLACVDCKVKLWLGKTIFREDDSINYFHIGGPEQPPNSQRPELNRTIWKMLADHAGHHLQVVVEGNPDDELLDDDDFVEIGGPGSALSFEEYLKGWDG